MVKRVDIKVSTPAIRATVANNEVTAAGKYQPSPVIGKTHHTLTIQPDVRGLDTSFNLQIDGAFSRDGLYVQRDELVNAIETINLDFERPFFDLTMGAMDLLTLQVGKNAVEHIQLQEMVALNIATIIPSELAVVKEAVQLNFSKGLIVDEVYNADLVTLGVEKGVQDAVATPDGVFFDAEKALKDTPHAIDSITLQATFIRDFFDVATVSESVSTIKENEATIEIAQARTIERVSLSPGKGVAEVMTTSERLSFDAELGKVDVAEAADSAAFSVISIRADAATASDSLAKGVGKAANDSVQPIEVTSGVLQSYVSGDYFSEFYLGSQFSL